MNSAILTFTSVAISLVAAVLAAHALTYYRLAGAEMIVKGIASLMVVPVILLVIPIFVQFARLGLIDSYLGAIVVYAGVTLPFAIYLLTRFFAAVPRSLLEAATIDGANSWTVLVRVVLPLAKPAVITLAVISAFFVWNDLLIALILLQSDDLKPLMVGLTTIAGRETRDVPLTLAAVTFSVIPIVVLYLASQRLFVRGIYGGAMRGE
jgi:ABC-type glycerol-3-phosphate transport system permease component